MRPLNIDPFNFDGSPGILYWLAGFTAVFLLGVFWDIGSGSIDGGLIPAAVIFGAATYFYWWWHERRPYIEIDRRIVQEAAREPKIEPPKDRPPTPEESKLAVGRMRAALSYVDKFLADREVADLRTAILVHASREVIKARNLDPNATVTTTAEDGSPLNFNLDSLAAHIMFYEANAYLTEARKAREAMWEYADMANSDNPKEYVAMYKEEQDRIIANANKHAMAAAGKLLAYNPNSPLYLRTLAEVYRNMHRNTEADDLIKKAYALDPDDVETIKMMP